MIHRSGYGFAIMILLFLPLVFSSCQSKDELMALSKCEFRVKDVGEVTLGGVPIDGVEEVNDLTNEELGVLLLGILTENLPLALTINVEVRNPNEDVAALDKAEWILYVDNKMITEGLYDERIEIPPHNGISLMRVPVTANIAEIMAGESNEALLNLALNLANAGSQPSLITLKAKPYIRVRNRLIPYPGFFDIKTEFTSGE